MCLHSVLDEYHHYSGQCDVDTDPIEQLPPYQTEVWLKDRVEEVVEDHIQVGQE